MSVVTKVRLALFGSHLALLVMLPLVLPDPKALLALAFLTLDPSTLASHHTSYSCIFL